MFQVSPKRLPGLLPYDMGARRKEAMGSLIDSKVWWLLALAQPVLNFLMSRIIKSKFITDTDKLYDIH